MHAEAADAVDYNVGLKDRVAGGIQNCESPLASDMHDCGDPDNRRLPVIGQITGDAQQEASGKAQQVKGEQLQAATAPPELRK